MVDGSASLLQAKPLARGEPRNGLADAPLARLRPFGEVDPDDEVAALSARQCLKKSPRVTIGPDGFGGVAFMANRSSSRRLIRLSIHPKHNASRTESS